MEMTGGIGNIPEGGSGKSLPYGSGEHRDISQPSRPFQRPDTGFSQRRGNVPSGTGPSDIGPDINARMQQSMPGGEKTTSNEPISSGEYKREPIILPENFELLKPGEVQLISAAWRPEIRLPIMAIFARFADQEITTFALPRVLNEMQSNSELDKAKLSQEADLSRPKRIQSEEASTLESLFGGGYKNLANNAITALEAMGVVHVRREGERIVAAQMHSEIAAKAYAAVGHGYALLNRLHDPNYYDRPDLILENIIGDQTSTLARLQVLQVLLELQRQEKRLNKKIYLSQREFSILIGEKERALAAQLTALADRELITKITGEAFGLTDKDTPKQSIEGTKVVTEAFCKRVLSFVTELTQRLRVGQLEGVTPLDIERGEIPTHVLTPLFLAETEYKSETRLGVALNYLTDLGYITYRPKTTFFLQDYQVPLADDVVSIALALRDPSVATREEAESNFIQDGHMLADSLLSPENLNQYLMYSKQNKQEVLRKRQERLAAMQGLLAQIQQRKLITKEEELTQQRELEKARVIAGNEGDLVYMSENIDRLIQEGGLARVISLTEDPESQTIVEVYPLQSAVFEERWSAIDMAIQNVFTTPGISTPVRLYDFSSHRVFFVTPEVFDYFTNPATTPPLTSGLRKNWNALLQNLQPTLISILERNTQQQFLSQDQYDRLQNIAQYTSQISSLEPTAQRRNEEELIAAAARKNADLAFHYLLGKKNAQEFARRPWESIESGLRKVLERMITPKVMIEGVARTLSADEFINMSIQQGRLYVEELAKKPRSH